MRRFAHLLGLLGLLAALVAVFGWRAEHFLSAATLRTVVNQLPDALLLATGMTLVLLVGGIDLSVGSVLGLSVGALGWGVARGWPLPLAAAAAVAVGGCCGLVNGALIVRFRLPAFLVTLGMFEAARGGAYLLTDSRTQYVGAAITRWSDASLGGLSAPLLVALALAAAAQGMLSRTVLGRDILAVGGSEEASHLAGVGVGRVRLAVYALSGTLAGIAGVVAASRLGAADPNAGTGAELLAIAAAVIGGTSLLGGRGGVPGALLGVLILGVLGNGLVQVGAQEPHKRLITGVVIVAAVLADVVRTRVEARSRVV